MSGRLRSRAAIRLSLLASLMMLGIAAGLLAGCATDQVSHNIYEGGRAYNDALKSTPLERSSSPSPSFEQYDRERRALSNQNQ